MLEMRPNCECCDTDLGPDADNAMICSFECTFCKECVTKHLHGVCPNCGGSFRPRPTREAHLLAQFPVSTQRKVNPDLLQGSAE